MKIGEYEVEVRSKNHIKVGCQLVTRPEVERVLRAMDEWKPAPKFKVGDFVKVIDGLHAYLGKYGRVVSELKDGLIGVEFAERVENGWDLEGRSRHGHGRWFVEKSLELVD